MTIGHKICDVTLGNRQKRIGQKKLRRHETLGLKLIIFKLKCSTVG